MEIEVVGGSYSSRSTNLNAQRTVNLFVVVDQQEGKKVRALVGTPGLVEWCDLSTEVEIRNMLVMGDYAYAVGGNKLYQITSGAVASAEDGTLGTSTGHVYMDSDGTNLLVIDPGQEGYTYTAAGGELTAIADADFPTPSSGCVIDGYAIVSKSDTDQFYISALNDFTSWDALDYASVESAPGVLKRVARLNRLLICLKESNMEPWYNSGASDFPWERVSGVYIEHGIEAPASFSAINGVGIWLNQFRQVVAYDGTTRIVSTEQIEYAFNSYSSVTNAKAYCLTKEGHTFYVLVFPNENTTWMYDLTTGFWSELQSYPVVDGEYSRHRGNCFCRFAGKDLEGDYINGKIYYLDLDTFTDNGETIRRMRITQSQQQQHRPIFFHELELEMETGIGLITGQGSEPRIMMQYSDDGGHTWSSELWANIGEIGKYSTRVKWHRLGRSRHRIWQFAITDPIKVVILGGHIRATVGVN